MPERLQKLLAQAGYGSRRACEEFISAGRVRVNGQVAILGQKADPSVDKITLDGKPLAAPEKLTYIALYKPRNVISSIDDEVGRSLTYASHEPVNGEKEVALWFKKEELVDWKREVDKWIFEK